MSYEKPNLKSKHFNNLFNNLPSMEGKTVAITGTTSGTGFVAAQACGKLGARVLLLNRPSTRADAALNDLQSHNSNADFMSKNPPPLHVAVVGATGMVGRTILKVMEEHDFPVSTLLPVASVKSVGSTVKFNGEEVTVVSIEDALAARPDVALFSAGGCLSLEWAPRFAEAGITVVDNSSAWRMSDEHKLVVPEVNGDVLDEEDLVIANPNCTTMQLVMCLKPLHDRWRITRGVVNTYQSVTGTGQAAVAQLEAERSGEEGPGVYPHPIDKNCLPHCDTFQDHTDLAKGPLAPRPSPSPLASSIFYNFDGGTAHSRFVSS